MKHVLRSKNAIALVSILATLCVPAVARASCPANSLACSTNYMVGETYFGNGGQLNACSTSYCTKQAAGETTIGNPKSTSYQIHAGFDTNRAPSLTFIVNAANINLGTLTPGTASTATATFSVKSYLASGYIVQTDANPPKMGSHTLHNLTTPTSSNTSQEQFGMNLVANTTACGAPANYGASPVQVPSGTYSFGQAATNYATCGKYTYNNGDTIAQSSQSSGETDYTISYLFNITNLTPGGVYTFNDVLVATSTF